MMLPSGTTQDGFELQTDFNNPIRTFFTPAYDSSNGKRYALIALIPLYGITDGTKHPNFKWQYLFRLKTVGYDSVGGVNSEVTLVFDRVNSTNQFQLQVKNFNNSEPIDSNKIVGIFIDNTIRLYLYVDNLAYKVDILAITRVQDGVIYENDTTTGIQLESNNGQLTSTLPTGGTNFSVADPTFISSQNVTGNGTLNLVNDYIWNLYGNGGTSLAITFSGYNYSSKVITLVIRSTNGTTPLTFSFASNVKLPSGFPTSATFQTAVACQFIWHSVLNVWQCINWDNVPTGL